MLFRKKKLREKYNAFIMEKLSWYKQNLELEKEFMEKCYDMPEQVQCEYKVNRAKYFYLMNEARYRKIDVLRWKYK